MGAFVSRVMAHRYGGPFAMPHRPDPQQWRVISPGLEEGIGRAGAGRVTHVVDGALSIATHVFFRPDMVLPQLKGEANSVDIELTSDSGTLLLQIGPPPVKAIQLRPGAFRASVPGSQWISVAGARTFRLQGEDGRLMLLVGDQRRDVGTYRPGRLELSSEDDWARIARIVVQDARGVEIFAADFRNHGPSKLFLDNATVFGALFGLLIVWILIPMSVASVASVIGMLIPVLWVVVLPRDVWLSGVERLYLSRMPPSDLARFALAVVSVPLVMLALNKFVRLVARQPENRAHGVGPWVWLALAVASSASAEMLHGGSVLGWSVVGVCMASGALDALRRAPSVWWLVDSGAWLLLAMLGPDQGAIFLLIWRFVGVLGTTGLWLRTTPRVAVMMLLVAALSMPLGAEAWMRTTGLNDSWQMDRLSGERPNEKGWDSPVSGWTGRCGDENASRSISVVVAGGSSVGGAYQFGGEPQAFFTAKAHAALCRDLPADVRLTTHNFGDGDRNTYTISRTIDAHLESADILVMYVGVNDVFTTQNTMTRKQREERASGVQASSGWLPGWVRESRLAVGLALWFRPRPDLNAAQVADVPLPDAKDNHRMVIDAARLQGDRVVLLTEYVRSAQRSRLFSYAQMQQTMRAEDVRWVNASLAFENMEDQDSLVDSNHLSREGNVRLGEFLASQLTDWVYGSSR